MDSRLPSSLLVVTLVLFAACGGDSGSSSDRPERPERPRIDVEGDLGDEDVAEDGEVSPTDDVQQPEVDAPTDVAPDAPSEVLEEVTPDVPPRALECGPHLSAEELARPDAPVCEFFAHTRRELYAIDPYRKTIRRVGSLGSNDFFDIDTHPDGRLFGIGTSGGYRLAEIDSSSGTYRVIGALSGVLGTANGLCIDAAGRGYITSGNQLYEVDVDTAVVRRAPSTMGSFSSSGDCVFDRKGNDLYMTSRPSGSIFASRMDELVFIQASTGEAARVGDTGFSNIWGLTFAWDTLYGVTSTGQLIEIDTGTGQGRLVHNFGSGYEFMGAASTASPE